MYHVLQSNGSQEAVQWKSCMGRFVTCVPFSLYQNISVECAAWNSYILTMGILQVFVGAYPECSQASWCEGWGPSAWVQQCFTLFFFRLQTDLPCKKKEKKKNNSTNNLGVVSCHSSSAKQSQVELWERAERHLTLSRPVCHTGEWQNSNKASWSSQGLSFTHLISEGFRCSPDYSAFC